MKRKAPITPSATRTRVPLKRVFQDALTPARAAPEPGASGAARGADGGRAKSAAKPKAPARSARA